MPPPPSSNISVPHAPSGRSLGGLETEIATFFDASLRTPRLASGNDSEVESTVSVARHWDIETLDS